MKKFFIIYILLTFNDLCGQSTLKSFVAENAIQIESIDPDNKDYSDLEPIRNSIGSARIVMLGEQDHGDAPTFLAKTRLIKFLHEKMGFNVLAFESDFFALNQTNFPDFKKNIYSVWSQCNAVQPLFEYLDYNKSLATTGFDCRHTSFYSKGNFIAQFYEILNELEMDELSNDTLFASILKDLMMFEYKNSTQEKDKGKFLVQLETIQSSLTKNEIKNSEFWRQEISNLKAFVQNAWANKDLASINNDFRDKQMGDNILWLANEKYKNERIIVWAHNFHIAKNLKFSYPDTTAVTITAGNEVYKVLGDEVYVLGFTSYSGTAGRNTNEVSYKVAKSQKGSIERNLAKHKYSYAFIDMKLFSSENSKFIMKAPYHFNNNSDWGNVYDGIFYIKLMFPCGK